MALTSFQQKDHLDDNLPVQGNPHSRQFVMIPASEQLT